MFSIYSHNRMENLILQWYTVSEKEAVSTTDRMELYNNTKEAIDFLNTSRVEQNKKTKKKITNLCKKYSASLFEHNVPTELKEKLINFISNHTNDVFNPGDKFNGANVFQELINSILKVVENRSYKHLIRPYSGICQQILTKIDQEIIKKIEGKKQNLSLLNDCLPIVYSQMSSIDLLALKEAATDDMEIIGWIDNVLVDRFHKNLLFEELNIEMTLENVVEFFGENCSKIHTLELRLISPKFFDSPTAKQTSLLTHFPNLQKLRMRHCNKLSYSNLNFLKHCPKLISLEWSGGAQVTNLSVLEKIPNLQCLTLAGFEQLTHSKFLEHCSNLEELMITESSISDFRYVKHCPNLKKLNIDCPVSDFCFLEFLSNLESLTVSEFSDQGLKFLQFCKIKMFEIKNCANLIDFSLLSQMTHLEHLNLFNCIAKDFSFLEDCNKLKKVFFEVQQQEA